MRLRKLLELSGTIVLRGHLANYARFLNSESRSHIFTHGKYF